MPIPVKAFPVKDVNVDFLKLLGFFLAVLLELLGLMLLIAMIAGIPVMDKEMLSLFLALAPQIHLVGCFLLFSVQNMKVLSLRLKLSFLPLLEFFLVVLKLLGLTLMNLEVLTRIFLTIGGGFVILGRTCSRCSSLCCLCCLFLRVTDVFPQFVHFMILWLSLKMDWLELTVHMFRWVGVSFLKVLGFVLEFLRLS